MSIYLSVVPRDERYVQARRSSSPSLYIPSPTRLGHATQPSSDGHKPKLLDQVRSVLRCRHYSYQTQKTYVHWISRFSFFHTKRHPRAMGKQEVEQFLTSLAVDQHVSAATQNQALPTLLFLYREVLVQELGWLHAIIPAKHSQRLPTVLTQQEVRR